MQTIYIDVLLFVNLFVNYFLILATERVCRKKCKTIRRIIGDAVAAAASLAIFLPDFGIVFSVLFRLFVSAAVIIAAFGFGNARKFFTLMGGFYAVSFAYAGICFALWMTFKPKGVVIRNDAVYFQISPFLLISTCLACYFILVLLKKFFGKNSLENCTYDIEIVYGEKRVKVSALLDSGHRLYDVFSNLPVIILSESEASSLIRTEAFVTSAAGAKCDMPNGYRLIPYSVVGGGGVLPAFRPDSVMISGKDGIRSVKQCLIAVSKDLGAEYGALIGIELVEGGEKVC